ncbi:MAG: hypothetical protein Q4C42_04870, partial [Clostridia bacterium]|nr:hypothetical protein [Clostridia bacterium]
YLLKYLMYFLMFFLTFTPMILGEDLELHGTLSFEEIKTNLSIIFGVSLVGSAVFLVKMFLDEDDEEKSDSDSEETADEKKTEE